MNPIYIEVGDEITTVIERIRQAPGASVALIVPKGAILLQSIVNLKLARKAAQESGTQVTVVTTDKTGRNLASQVGFPVRSKADQPDEAGISQEGEVLPGVKVHRYYDQTAEEPDSPAVVVAPIIPRGIVSAAAPPRAAPTAIEPTESPIVTRSLEIDLPPARTGLPVVEIVRPSPVAVAELPPMLPVSPSPTLIEAVTLPGPAETAPMPANAASRPIRRRIPRPVVFIAYLLVLAVLIAGGIAAVYWPKTIVTAHLHAQTKTQELTVTAAPGASTDANNLTVPLETLTATASDTGAITATGTKDIGDTSTGMVHLTNLDTVDQSLPVGAQITASGHTFLTTKVVTVPAYKRVNLVGQPGTATVAIAAQTPGAEGNVTSDTAAILSPTTDLTASALSTAGGNSKQVKVVTQKDIDATKATLLAKLTESAKAALDKQAGDQKISADPLSDQTNMDKMTPSVLPDTQADTGQLSGQLTIKREGISLNHLNELAEARMAQQVDAQHALASGTATATSVACNPTSCTAKVTATGSFVTNADLQPLTRKLAGTATANGLDLLRSNAPDADFSIQRTPTWWPNHNFPPSAKYISIVVVHD